ncbi:MAG: ABC transporter substrate-binding protein [Gammaproteobacteria bacterium]|nr:ABC transporter substrate-binding protein [Gammaproteobacteria bacterium]NNC97149.1 ABC transporter substrate-binding protein [Gammaproteobacteria bacterium]NNM13721.1 ABC transporter substrate-binding protein [Gammaproteobacteria bacterium]
MTAKIALRLLQLCLVCALLACGEKQVSESRLQQSLLSPENAYPQRIVTLSPHLTELVYSLGLQNKLQATVEYSDYPQAAQSLPRIGDAFRLDWEKLHEYQPDLVIAWQNGNPQHIIDELQRKNYPVLALENPSLYELPEQLMTLSERIGGKEKAQQLGIKYRQGLEQLHQKYSSKKNLKIFYQISPDPLYTVNGTHVISEMLNLCGAQNVFANLGSIAAPVSAEAVLAANPDAILTTHEMLNAVREKWQAGGLIEVENIISVSADEVARASLRMLDGSKNICTTLDVWREKN